MTEKLTVSGAKDERYKQLVPQIKNLLGDKADIISDMANISAALKFAFKFFFCICFRYALRLTALSSYYIPAQFPMKSRLTAHTRHNSRQSAYAPFPSLCPYMTLL